MIEIVSNGFFINKPVFQGISIYGEWNPDVAHQKNKISMAFHLYKKLLRHIYRMKPFPMVFASLGICLRRFSSSILFRVDLFCLTKNPWVSYQLKLIWMGFFKRDSFLCVFLVRNRIHWIAHWWNSFPWLSHYRNLLIGSCDQQSSFSRNSRILRNVFLDLSSRLKSTSLAFLSNKWTFMKFPQMMSVSSVLSTKKANSIVFKSLVLFCVNHQRNQCSISFFSTTSTSTDFPKHETSFALGAYLWEQFLFVFTDKFCGFGFPILEFGFHEFPRNEIVFIDFSVNKLCFQGIDEIGFHSFPNDAIIFDGVPINKRFFQVFPSYEELCFCDILSIKLEFFALLWNKLFFMTFPRTKLVSSKLSSKKAISIVFNSSVFSCLCHLKKQRSIIFCQLTQFP